LHLDPDHFCPSAGLQIPHGCQSSSQISTGPVQAEVQESCCCFIKIFRGELAFICVPALLSLRAKLLNLTRF